MKVQIDKNYNLFLTRKTASVYDEPFSNQFKFTTVTYEIFLNLLLHFDCERIKGTRSSYIKILFHKNIVISIQQFTCRMLKTTLMGIIQSIFASIHIPEYFICAYNKMLWFEVFYKFPGWKTDCSRSTDWREKHRPCDLYNGVYTIINCFICFASIISSIELASQRKNTNYQSRKTTLLLWVIVEAVFVLHLVLLHFLAIRSIQFQLDDKDTIVNSLILTTFTVSMIVSFSMLVAGFLQFKIKITNSNFNSKFNYKITLQIKGEFELQEEIEKRIRNHIEGKSQKIQRTREAEFDPIKRLSLAVIENTMVPMMQLET